MSGLHVGRSLAWCLVAAIASEAAAQHSSEGEQVAAQKGVEHGARASPDHFWPSARGRQETGYMVTNETLPWNLSAAFSWKWHFPTGKYQTVVRGNPIFDSQKNIIIGTENGIFKLSPTGLQLWAYTPSATLAIMNTAPSIDGNSVYGSTIDGHVFSVSLKSGEEEWIRKHAAEQGGDTAYVEAHRGIVMQAVEKSPEHDGGNRRVLGLNATNGNISWEYRIEVPTWNFNPVFANDGSVFFMDLSGGVHRIHHHNGSRIWFTPAPQKYSKSFSDGGLMLGPDGTSYACSNNEDHHHGALRAYSFSDGKLLWDKKLPTGCTSWPAIAKDGSWGVVPMGNFVTPPLALMMPQWTPALVRILVHGTMLALGDKQSLLRAALKATTPEENGDKDPSNDHRIMAFDPRTGETKWTYRTRDWQRFAAKGDDEGLVERLRAGRSAICLPTSWGTPTISGDGTVYAGHVSGILYAVRDTNGDGQIDPDAEVYQFDMEGAPLPNNPAWAPGMMAMATCDSLFVFKS